MITNPAVVPSSAARYSYAGCYIDHSMGAAMNALTSYESTSSTMTVEICAGICNGINTGSVVYAYMGVEYG